MTDKKIQKVKVGFSIPKDVNEALDELCEISGINKSNYVSDILQQALPIIKQLTEAVKVAKSGDKEKFEQAMQNVVSNVHEFIDEETKDKF